MNATRTALALALMAALAGCAAPGSSYRQPYYGGAAAMAPYFMMMNSGANNYGWRPQPIQQDSSMYFFGGSRGITPVLQTGNLIMPLGMRR
jgi:hypothetical protein